jgi:hypothetical protein
MVCWHVRRSMRDGRCVGCGKAIAKHRLRIATAHSGGDKIRHVHCISGRMARSMMDEGRVSPRVRFFCEDGPRQAVCEQLKRIAFGIAGEE